MEGIMQHVEAEREKNQRGETEMTPGTYERVYNPDAFERETHRVPKERLPECGAKRRNGQPCRAKVVRGFARCRMHGGASTGPKTAVGKARVGAAVAAINRRRAAAKRAEALAAEE